MKLPFKWVPASWGLKGKAYDLAEAYYLYDGYDLEVRIAEIELSGSDLELRLIDLKLEYGIITESQAKRARIRVLYSGNTQEAELINIDIQEGLISKNDGDKKIANLLEEPWVGIISNGFDSSNGPNGLYFEFDWNDHWITLLKEHGYSGKNDEIIMEKWFRDVCVNEASEGMNLFNNMQTIKV